MLLNLGALDDLVEIWHDPLSTLHSIYIAILVHPSIGETLGKLYTYTPTCWKATQFEHVKERAISESAQLSITSRIIILLKQHSPASILDARGTFVVRSSKMAKVFAPQV